jgi:hypothetical protein
MVSTVDNDDFCNARAAYREQIEFGSEKDTALNLATIVYQQRHPCVPACKAKAMVGAALGING